ncbi:hypothetical protein LUZ60_010346 [Juncus effusus]|nr:hypothetical protein LUZ60_010346 [Juncus effusus]
MDSDDCYDFCVTAFNTVPESRTADLAGLVMIVTVLTKGNHTSISQKAKDLLNQSGWSHMMEQCLLTCVVVYESSVVDLEHAIDYVKERNYGEFASLMVAVNTMPVTCDDGFEELGEKNLLKDENDAAFELGEITQAIFQLLQN